MDDSGPARRRFGVFGGTFDPPHLGHLLIAQEAWFALALDQVLFVPTRHPPHKAGRTITSARHRQKMVECAIAFDSRFELSLIEFEREGPSYTVDTLDTLHRHQPDADLFLILGGDMVMDLPQWRNPAKLVESVTGIIAIRRPGFVFDEDDLARLEYRLPELTGKLFPIDAPQYAVSSTQVRARVAHDMPISYLVSESVANYIKQHQLYRDRSSSARKE
jgi:nicotinate-nucleotide adenylyltransferase